jgi:hypothetical protein
VAPSDYRGHYYPKREIPYDFIVRADHTRPLRIFHQGQVFGLFQLVDALLGRRPQIEDYGLSAGEISLHIGVPTGSDELVEALKELKEDLKWQKWQRHSLLVQELLANKPWKCNIVLIPDSLCEVMGNSLELEHLLFKAQMSQMSQVIDEMNERTFIRNRITKPTDRKEQYHEQISYLLGIVRGQIPAMVPWQRSKVPLPLAELRDAIMMHTCKRPTARNTDQRYYPYIMVPRLLDPGEKGYFSCKWNVGPVTPMLFASDQMKAIVTILSECLPDIFSHQDTADMFKPFLHSERSSISAVFRKKCIDLDEADFIPPGTTIDCAGLPSRRKLGLTLRKGGFLNSGFVVTRPTWL